MTTKTTHTPWGHDCGMDAEHCPECRKDLKTTHTPETVRRAQDLASDLGHLRIEGLPRLTDLYAAAPDLLAAAKLGAKMLLRNTLQDAEDTEVYNMLRAAIARAEGR